MSYESDSDYVYAASDAEAAEPAICSAKDAAPPRFTSVAVSTIFSTMKAELTTAQELLGCSEDDCYGRRSELTQSSDDWNSNASAMQFSLINFAGVSRNLQTDT